MDEFLNNNDYTVFFCIIQYINMILRFLYIILYSKILLCQESTPLVLFI